MQRMRPQCHPLASPLPADVIEISDFGATTNEELLRLFELPAWNYLF